MHPLPESSHFCGYSHGVTQDTNQQVIMISALCWLKQQLDEEELIMSGAGS